MSLADNSGPLGRTVSMATFVIEKLYFDEGIPGNKRVNILLHIAIGGLLIWLFSLLFRQQGVPNYKGLALVLAAIWLLHPLLVSTVLYVVQRMAMLATFFMLLSAISYVYWRRRGADESWHLMGLVPVFVFLVLGLLCKENAIVIIPILLLMELLWFQSRNEEGLSPGA